MPKLEGTRIDTRLQLEDMTKELETTVGMTARLCSKPWLAHMQFTVLTARVAQVDMNSPR